MQPRISLLTAALAITTAPVLAADQRQTLAVSPEVRAIVLAEMRDMLGGVQGIVAGLARNDMAAVAAAARPLGMQMARHMPVEARQQLPMEFRQRGHATHVAFDQIVLDAEGLGDTQHSLGQLAAAMENCVGCHALFQLQSGVE
jgi:hypothetical protein